ncbi:MAG: hypothetical protein IJI35_03775 [Kiritimatiellae bacterium]|nr:hypothetical protein [Kiritimatiellia bacterium]
MTFMMHFGLLLAATLSAAAWGHVAMPDCAIDSDDLEYLKKKWRTDVTDEDTGLGTDGVLDGWREIVAARGDEPWETTKAKLFAFGCDRTAVGVSPHDWFPAFAPWSFHRGHPLWKILPKRAAEVDGLHSPGLREKIAAGEKIGRWVVWKDYSHCAPDWDYIIPLGFTGMSERLLANWKDTPYYHSRRIAADAALRLVGRLAEHARRANEDSPSLRLAAEAVALAHLRDGAPRTAYEVMLFIYLEWVMGENFDGFQVRTLSNLDRILTPYYRADIAAGRTTEAEFRDQLRHFWWQWGSIDNYFGQPVYFGGTKADGTTEYNEVSRILLEEHDQLGLPTPKVHIKTGPSTPDWVWRKTPPAGQDERAARRVRQGRSHGARRGARPPARVGAFGLNGRDVPVAGIPDARGSRVGHLGDPHFGRPRRTRESARVDKGGRAEARARCRAGQCRRRQSRPPGPAGARPQNHARVMRGRSSGFTMAKGVRACLRRRA